MLLLFNIYYYVPIQVSANINATWGYTVWRLYCRHYNITSISQTQRKPIKGNRSYAIKGAINTQHILLVDSYLVQFWVRITRRRRKLLPLVLPRALLEVTSYTSSKLSF